MAKISSPAFLLFPTLLPAAEVDIARAIGDGVITKFGLDIGDSGPSWPTDCLLNMPFTPLIGDSFGDWWKATLASLRTIGGGVS